MGVCMVVVVIHHVEAMKLARLIVAAGAYLMHMQQRVSSTTVI